MTISRLPSIFNGLIDCTAAYCNVKFEAKSIQLHNWYMTAILAKKLKLYHKETQDSRDHNRKNKFFVSPSRP